MLKKDEVNSIYTFLVLGGYDTVRLTADPNDLSAVLDPRILTLDAGPPPDSILSCFFLFSVLLSHSRLGNPSAANFTDFTISNSDYAIPLYSFGFINFLASNMIDTSLNGRNIALGYGGVLYDSTAPPDYQFLLRKRAAFLLDLADDGVTVNLVPLNPSAPIPDEVNRYAHAMCHSTYFPAPGRAVLFGGVENTTLGTGLWTLDLTDGTWRLENAQGTPPSNRVSTAIACTATGVYVFGGNPCIGDACQPLAPDLYYYDFGTPPSFSLLFSPSSSLFSHQATSTWEMPANVGGPKPLARGSHSMTTLSGNRILVYGGIGWLAGNPVVLSDAVVYYAEDNRWEYLCSDGSPYVGPRHSHSVAVVEYILLSLSLSPPSSSSSAAFWQFSWTAMKQ